MVGEGNKLTELNRSSYQSEDLLQNLLATFPSVLGSTGTGPLLLVRREFGVPGEADAADRWSLDHLFLDRAGVPILVEVKRATDTRARREVVAQMLDYAANGVAYWPIDQIVEAVEEGARHENKNCDTVLREFLGELPVDQFRRQVESNLRSGRIKMVFVADKIARELRRIVEFLNEQMRPAEVLAVEVEQYVSSDGMRTLVPRVLGDTERANATKAVHATRGVVSEDDWLASLLDTKGSAVEAIARRLLDWFRTNGFEVGVTNSGDSMTATVVRPDGKVSYPFFIRRSTGRLETSLQYLQFVPAYAGEDKRRDLLASLKSVTQELIATPKLTGWPAIPLVALQEENTLERFCKVAKAVQQSIVEDSDP